MLTHEDKELLAKKGISEEQIAEQLACFEKGFPYLQLAAAASVDNNGIMIADADDQKKYLAAWDAYKDTDKKIVKFVPASGAASRMFKNMFEFLGADYDEPTTDFEKKFFDHIHDFAFYNDLNAACMDNTGKNIDALLSEHNYKAVVSNLLEAAGLNYGSLPKGLLKFHRYADGVRTPLEEHLVEGALYAAGKTGTVSMTGGNRDIWMAAYTPEISVSVWMGFDQTDAKHKISNGVTGGRNTASLAAAFFKKAYADRDKPNFSQPDGLIWLTLDKRALTSRGSVMLASDKTPKEYRISEVFAASNRPYAVSDIWQAPNAPSSFYVAHSAGGYPELHFKASSDARYRIQRDAVGESVILTEMVASSGQALSFLDTSAQAGVLYTYRIIPIHEELLQQGVWLEGKQAVQLAQVQAGSGMISGLRSLIPALAIQHK